MCCRVQCQTYLQGCNSCQKFGNPCRTQMVVWEISLPPAPMQAVKFIKVMKGTQLSQNYETAITLIAKTQRSPHASGELLRFNGVAKFSIEAKCMEWVSHCRFLNKSNTRRYT
jgi:hypothetical protein